jgi:hypothetical protein
MNATRKTSGRASMTSRARFQPHLEVLENRLHPTDLVAGLAMQSVLGPAFSVLGSDLAPPSATLSDNHSQSPASSGRLPASDTNSGSATLGLGQNFTPPDNNGQTGGLRGEPLSGNPVDRVFSHGRLPLQELSPPTSELITGNLLGLTGQYVESPPGVILHWNHAGFGITSFQIKRYTDTIRTVSARETTFSDDNDGHPFTPCAVYPYTLVARNSSGGAVLSATVAVKIPCTPLSV